MKLLTKNETETIKAGATLGKVLTPGSVVALGGGLGVGKTAFVRGIAQSLGISALITSPTYTIVNEYHGTIPLFHFDAYRLDSEYELYDIGWDEYLTRGGICAVEWFGIVPGAIPHDAFIVQIEQTSDYSRKIEIQRGLEDYVLC